MKRIFIFEVSNIINFQIENSYLKQYIRKIRNLFNENLRIWCSRSP